VKKNVKEPIHKDEQIELKFVLTGDGGVGKSSLVLRYFDDTFTEQFISTIGVDYKAKILDIDDKKVNIKVWDTAGQERFRTLTSQYYRGAQVVIIVFDVTKKQSFDNLRLWIRDAVSNVEAKIVIIGNKLDKSEKRKVTTQEAMMFVSTYEVSYFETSCLTGHGIEAAFKEIATLCL